MPCKPHSFGFYHPTELIEGTKLSTIDGKFANAAVLSLSADLTSSFFSPTAQTISKSYGRLQSVSRFSEAVQFWPCSSSRCLLSAASWRALEEAPQALPPRLSRGLTDHYLCPGHSPNCFLPRHILVSYPWPFQEHWCASQRIVSYICK